MKELIDKLSSYNIFNYLFPGVLFVIILSKVSSYDFVQKDLLIGPFFYYFIGLVISRLGSIFIEPVLKKVKFVKFCDYKKFVSASKQDAKIELFSEVNNMYRTICSMLILILFVKCYEIIELRIPILKEYNGIILIGLLFVLFIFSYRKQTNYITKRVESNDK
ncbi:MAG: hypothetical protein PHR62_10220 [Paludibacter sp.]|nr:hypothetical protein [Paludibacter sp.]